MLAGVILGTPTLRLRGDYLAIVTLGLRRDHPHLRQQLRLARRAAGHHRHSAPAEHRASLSSTGTSTSACSTPSPTTGSGLTLIIIVIFFLRRLENSRVGRAWTAIREDEDAAELMGVPTFKFKLWAFAIGAAIGGLAGSLYASKIGFINPDNFPLLLSILFLAAVVLGGSGNIPGVILGAVVISYGPERFRNFADKRYFVFGVVLVLVMVFRPQGLLPSRRRAGRAADTPAVKAPALHRADPTTPPHRRTGRRWLSALLELDRVTMQFGGITALDDVTVHVDTGEIIGLIGPNGAGKTTVFNVVTGVYQPTLGRRPLQRRSRSPARSATRSRRAGIARTFQNIRLFPRDDRARERDGRRRRARAHVSVPGALAPPSADAEPRRSATPRHARWSCSSSWASRRQADECAPQPALRRSSAGSRSPAPWPPQPKILLLDEPAAGFNPAEKRELVQLIRTHPRSRATPCC